LILRGFTPDDFEPFAAIVSDPEVVRFLDDGAPISREECWRGIAVFLGHWHLRGYGWWAVEERDTGRFLGRIGLYNPEGWPGIEVGWLLGREVWGRGLATEGAKAALAFAFDVVGADHVISLIDPRNTRSIRVAEKIGARYEGELQHKARTLVVYGTHRDRAKT
jgi:RimJ/RimL family protein N-acetyltransferase